MNTKLAIIASAAAFATVLPAQTTINVMGATDITVGGLIAVGLKNSEVTSLQRPADKAPVNETYLCDNTSRFIISSTSKFANGWMVLANVESRFEVNDGPGTNLVPSIPGVGTTGATYGGWAEGETFGGIYSPYGTITFGKNSIYYADSLDSPIQGAPAGGESYRIWDANGLSVFNMLSGVPSYAAGTAVGSKFTLGNTRAQGVVKYISPKFNGVQVVLAWSKNPYGSTLNYLGGTAPAATPYSYENGGMAFAKVVYNSGPINANVSLLQIKNQGGPTAYNGNTDAYRAACSYTFDFGLKVGVVFDHTAVSDNIVTATGALQTASRDVWVIPVAYRFGDHGVYVTYSNAGSCSSIQNSGAYQTNIGYDYAMTKRAFIGVMYTMIHNDSAADYAPFLGGTNLGPSGPIMGESWHQISLDLNYWF
jgi:predicted porin